MLSFWLLTSFTSVTVHVSGQQMYYILGCARTTKLEVRYVVAQEEEERTWATNPKGPVERGADRHMPLRP